MSTGRDAPPELVLPFARVRASDLPRVGGKGANLGEMFAAGFPVPEGFCVTTAAFDRFVAACPEAEARMAEVDACVADDLDAIRRAAGALRAALEATAIPGELAAAITEQFALFEVGGSGRGGGSGWAVRSSATLEDLAEASFAGQQDTYLDVRGVDSLLDRVRACWASLFTDRAVAYRRQRGFGSRAVKLSVVVQRMVRSEVSGILFTADPVSGHRGVISIDASYGLGEALVSGIVDADNYRVDRRTGDLIELRLGAKAVEILPGEGGPRRVEVDEARRAQRALDDGLLAELTALGEGVEAHYGAPQDLEWCVEAGALYLVQARPITTLFPIPAAPEDRGLHVYLSFNHIQVMTDAILPLGIDTLKFVLPVGKREASERSSVMRDVAGRIFIDATPAMLRRFTRERLPKIMVVMDTQMARMLAEVVEREGFAADDGRPRANLGHVARSLILPVLARVFANLSWRDPAAYRSRAEARLGELTQRWIDAIEAPAEARDQLARARAVVGSMLPTLILTVFHVVLTGMLSWRALRELSGDDPRVEQLTRGLEGNVTTQMDLELGDLADLARANAKLRERLREDPRALLEPEALAGLEGAAELVDGWRVFLDRYGHRGIGEIDMTRTRWAEDPSSLLQSLAGMLRDATIGAHREQHRAGAEAADEAAASLLAEARGPKRWLMRRLIVRMRAGLALREHPKFAVMRVLFALRRVVLKVGAELVAAGRLDAADEVFWLDHDELARAVADDRGAASEDLRGLVARRRADYAGYAGLRVPRVITSEGEVPQPRRSGSLPPGTLEGVSASRGVVEGVARVILDPSTQVMHHGEILVAPFTDPGWTPLFIHAAALVMEVGGLMTHGSVVAREYGIPAVVGVEGATTSIETGQRIRVDGDSGLVTILGDED